MPVEIAEAEVVIDELEQLLLRHRGRVACGSRLEAAMLFARKMANSRRGDSDIPPDDQPLHEMHGI